MEPIFEIIDGDKHYKIYENGKIEGFNKGAIVFNRIPGRIWRVIAKEKKLQKSIFDCLPVADEAIISSETRRKNLKEIFLREWKKGRRRE